MNRMSGKWRLILWFTLTPLVTGLLLAVAFHFDDAVRLWVSEHQSHALKIFARNVSHFGNWQEHFAAGLIMAGIAWLRGSKKWMRIFLSMLIALAVAGLAGRVVKISTGRARPSVKSEEVWNGPKLSSRYNSFPSGHVVASVAFFAVLLLANWRIGLGCLAIPVIIGFSRIYVGAHYLSDVMCAALLGIFSAILVRRFFLPREIENRKSRIEN